MPSRGLGPSWAYGALEVFRPDPFWACWTCWSFSGPLEVRVPSWEGLR